MVEPQKPLLLQQLPQVLPMQDADTEELGPQVPSVLVVFWESERGREIRLMRRRMVREEVLMNIMVGWVFVEGGRDCRAKLRQRHKCWRITFCFLGSKVIFRL